MSQQVLLPCNPFCCVYLCWSYMIPFCVAVQHLSVGHVMLLRVVYLTGKVEQKRSLILAVCTLRSVLSLSNHFMNEVMPQLWLT